MSLLDGVEVLRHRRVDGVASMAYWWRVSRSDGVATVRPPRRHRGDAVAGTTTRRRGIATTPSTRRRPRNCICSMAWRLYATDATLSP